MLASFLIVCLPPLPFSIANFMLLPAELGLNGLLVLSPHFSKRYNLVMLWEIFQGAHYNFYTWLRRLRVPVCKTWPVVFNWIIAVLIMIIMEVKNRGKPMTWCSPWRIDGLNKYKVLKWHFFLPKLILDKKKFGISCLLYLFKHELNTRHERPVLAKTFLKLHT